MICHFLFLCRNIQWKFSGINHQNPLRIRLSGFFNIFVKNFTTIPVQTAAMTVPSRAPTMVPLKKIRDKRTDKATLLISNTILTLPKFLCKQSDIVLTTASPAFMMTLAITESAMPKPRITTPLMTKSILTG